MDSKEIRIEPSSSADSFPAYARLYKTCFPHNQHINPPYLKWLYQDNPVGPAIGFDGYCGQELVGQISLVPFEFLLHGVKTPVMLCVNMAVHPKFQAGSLFKQLCTLTLERAASQGYFWVIGIANAISTLVCRRKFGFHLVSSLDAAIGVGPLYRQPENNTLEGFSHLWTPETLNWRIKNPANPIMLRKRGSIIDAYADAKKWGLLAYAQIPSIEPFELASEGIFNSLRPRVYIGLSGTLSRTFLYKDIPTKLRPSPLNLLCKNLQNSQLKLTKEECHINFLDFDAF